MKVQSIDKSRLKEMIQKCKQNHLLYLAVSVADVKSLDAALQRIDLFTSKHDADIIVLRKD